ncbi:carboxymuconolactone decarboxylase family protein [Sphingomonas sp. MMS24-JH45]
MRAAPDCAISHIAVAEMKDGMAVTWSEKVSDEDYRGARRDDRIHRRPRKLRRREPGAGRLHRPGPVRSGVGRTGPLAARPQRRPGERADRGYRVDELPAHMRIALKNGVTADELKALVTHLALDAGWPAASTANGILRQVLGEEDALRPHVHCLMMASLDGRQHPSRWTESPDGTRKDWARALRARARPTWRRRLACRSRDHGRDEQGVRLLPPASFDPPPCPVHVARRSTSHAVAIDRAGKLHFDKGNLGGDHVAVLLGGDVADAHLAELVADGVSYFVSDGRGNRPRDPRSTCSAIASASGASCWRRRDGERQRARLRGSWTS